MIQGQVWRRHASTRVSCAALHRHGQQKCFFFNPYDQRWLIAYHDLYRSTPVIDPGVEEGSLPPEKALKKTHFFKFL